MHFDHWGKKKKEEVASQHNRGRSFSCFKMSLTKHFSYIEIWNRVSSCLVWKHLRSMFLHFTSLICFFPWDCCPCVRVLIHVDVHESTQHVPYHLVCLISLTTGWILIGLMRATARTNPLSKQKSPTQVTPYFKQTLILTHLSDTEISAVESEHGLFPDSPPSLVF